MGNHSNNQNLEPIDGHLGWYLDPQTGKTYSEDQLGAHLDDIPEIEDGDQAGYQMFEGEPGQFLEEDGSQDQTQNPGNNLNEVGDSEISTPSESENGSDNDTGKGGEKTPGDAGGDPSEEPLDKFKKPTDALDALPTEHMGEAGEKIEDAKKAIKLAKDIEEAVASDGTSLLNAKKDLEMIRDAEYLAEKYAKEALKKQIIAAVFVFLLTISVPIMIGAVAIMGFKSSDGGIGLSPPSSATGTWIWPTKMPPGAYSDSAKADYGPRIHPITGENQFHEGIDIGAPSGNPIYASRGGTVTVAEYESGCGNYIELRHPDGTGSQYCHASKLISKIGDNVNQGDVIAEVGSTGRSTGPHLHFAVFSNYATREKTDPEALLPKL